jgi:YggT family protein
VRPVWEILFLVVFVFLLLLIGRFVIQIIQNFARDWRPHGVVLVISEVIYSATDPPLRLTRRLIPPIRLGGISLDLGFTLLFLLVVVLMSLLRSLASA